MYIDNFRDYVLLDSGQRYAELLVDDFKTLTCQVTSIYDTNCADRICTEPAIKYTACY